MEDVVSSPPSPNIKKRSAPEEESPSKKPLNLKGNQFMPAMPTPPDTDQSSAASPGISIKNEENDDHNRAASPAPSSSALSSTVEVADADPLASSATPGISSTAVASSSGPPPAKRRKLTPSEKLEKQRAKEAKDREKSELKAQKEEEKRVKDEEKAELKARKDEEKRVKDEEKRQKAEEKEVKKRDKELEEERKVQEKLKKERSQMRLGVFFQQKPQTPTQNADSDENQVRARRRSLSLELYDNIADQIRRSASPVKGTPKDTPPPPVSEKKLPLPKPQVSDYHKTFLPFQVQPNTCMLPLTQDYSEAAEDAFDRELKDSSLPEKYDLGMVSSYQGHAELGHYFDNERHVQRGIPCPKTRDLVEEIQGTSQQPIDLTETRTPEIAISRLRRQTVKTIHFYEDVRPAYHGTYTRVKSPRAVRRMKLNPFTRARTDTDYDYDSEAEWEEPDEGDDEVLSDDEDEADSQAGDDDIDFLDDEDDTAKNKRKMITGELIPASTGLCWVNDSGRISVVDSIEVDERPAELQVMSMGVLIPGFTGGSIDPFCATYWNTAPAPATSVVANDALAGIMAPPRQPLLPKKNSNAPPQHDLIGASQGEKGPITSVYATQTPKRGPKPAPKTLSKEDLEEFKEAVVDSSLGKLDLQKGLKKRFPKMTNEVIKETLSSQFAQVGKGKADKRWVFIS